MYYWRRKNVSGHWPGRVGDDMRNVIRIAGYVLIALGGVAVLIGALGTIALRLGYIG